MILGTVDNVELKLRGSKRQKAGLVIAKVSPHYFFPVK